MVILSENILCKISRLVYKRGGLALDRGDGEKLFLGAGLIIPLRIGDLDICSQILL